MSAVETRPRLPAGLGEPIKGPTALGNDFKRFWRLTWTLATIEFKLRFFDSRLGYLWSFMKPTLLFGVLYLVFTQALKFGSDLPDFPVALLLGIVVFYFFSEATSQSVRSLVMRETLVRKVDFPRLAVPLSSVLTATFSLALNLIPVLMFALASGVTPRWSWLWFPLLLLILVFFTVGLSMLLSALFVRYRDIDPIWEVVLQVMFYASAIFFPIDRLLGGEYNWLGRVLMANPLAAILQEMRHLVISPKYLSAKDAIGLEWRLLIPIGIVLGTFALGYRVFSREAPRIAEDL
jgi:ABC-2 type transport system permease protein